ncbi:MAG: serine acetyltransferase, partial [Pseudomonadota bacterium]
MVNHKRTRDLLLRSTHLEVDKIVAELRALRLASLESRQRHDRPPKLPSRKILAGVAEGLCAALFPSRLGSSELADEGIDHYVGHMLNMTLRELMVQVQHELHYHSNSEVLSNEDRAQSVVITQAFAKRLPEVRTLLESDIMAAYEGDPAARNV